MQEKGTIYEYCENIAPGETDKICREIGALKSFRNKVNNNKVWEIHQRAYKKYYARVMKKKMTKDEFLVWTKNAEKIRDKALLEYKDCEDSKNEFPFDKYTTDLNYL